MHNILLLGAGKSTATLIDYLLDACRAHGWQLTIADQQLGHLQSLTAQHDCLKLKPFDVNREEDLGLIAEASLVISMLPARFHPLVARRCLHEGKHLVTASYLSSEVRQMHADVSAKELLFLNELGLDPGLDHLSAMQLIDQLRREGARLTAFHSFTGGLVAPEFDDNIWHYKFTWNPRNVVLAGQGTALYIQQGQYKHIPYHRVFRNTEPIFVEGLGRLEGYPNRDSLRYRSVYGLDDIPTMKRGTLRAPGFCQSWDKFVQMGMTDDSYTLENSDHCTFREFTNTFMEFAPDKTVEHKFAEMFGIAEDGAEMEKFRWLGLFSDECVNMPDATPAQILQAILEPKWQLNPGDQDMIVMQHQFDYESAGQERKLVADLIVRGADTRHTAMARTVGLPLGIAVKLMLQGKIRRRGVLLPTHADIYQPILAELAELGISFHEQEVEPA